MTLLIRVAPSAEAQAAHAYIRRVTEDDGAVDGIVATWVYSGNARCIVEADPTDLLFIDGLTVDEILIKFDGLYPVSRHGMCNIIAPINRNSFVGRIPTTITIFDYEWYDGDSAEEVVELARKSPTKSVIVCTDVPSWGGVWMWPGNSVYDHIKRRYVRCLSPLEDHGCYERRITRTLAGIARTVTEVVYDPDVIKRRIEIRERRALHGNKKSYKGPILIHEIDIVTCGLVEMLPKSNLLCKPNGRNKERGCCMASLMSALHLIWLLYDVTAHRQCKEFQDFLVMWRKRAAPTRRAWARTDVSGWSTIFQWFDEEAKHKKPRKRALRVLSRFPV